MVQTMHKTNEGHLTALLDPLSLREQKGLPPSPVGSANDVAVTSPDVTMCHGMYVARRSQKIAIMSQECCEMSQECRDVVACRARSLEFTTRQQPIVYSSFEAPSLLHIYERL